MFFVNHFDTLSPKACVETLGDWFLNFWKQQVYFWCCLWGRPSYTLFLVIARTPGQENRDKKTGRENPVPLVYDLKIRTYTANRIAPGVPADEHGIEQPGHPFSHSRTS